MNTADYLLAVGEDQDLVILTKKLHAKYGDLRKASARLLGELVTEGVRPLDRVGILSKNSLFWTAAYLAILKLGAIAVPFPTVSTSEDFQRKSTFMKCKLLCLEKVVYRRYSRVIDENLNLVFDDILDHPGPSVWDSFQTGFDIDQDAALMLTSGTTASPRAVRITHRNIQANTDSIIEYLELSHKDRILVVLPFFYCFGTSLMHTHLRAGGSMVICNTFAYPETALDMIENWKATGIAGVPSTYQTLLRSTTLPQRELNTLNKVQQAGGKLSVVFIKELKDSLPKANLYIMYGQTEATARLSYLPPKYLDKKLGSIGRGIPGVELQVLNNEGNLVDVGEVGEIVASGDNISPGYLDDPVATAEKFVGGKLFTGDLGKIDHEGFIYIVDRKSDFIKSMGHRVSSQEIEDCILQLPEVVSSAAIGVPDDIQGEAILVFVTLQLNANLSPEAIIAHSQQKLARHMVPKDVIIIDRLPMNAHGKVIKSELRKRIDSETV